MLRVPLVRFCAVGSDVPKSQVNAGIVYLFSPGQGMLPVSLRIASHDQQAAVVQADTLRFTVCVASAQQ